MRKLEIEFSDDDIKEARLNGIHDDNLDCIELFILPDTPCHISLTKFEIKQIAEAVGLKIEQ